MLKTKRRQIKFIAPNVQALHPRDRLLRRIDNAAESRRSIWIGAPAGAGKTSLAALCAARFKGTVIWFRVEAGDRDVRSFIGNLYAATGLKPPQDDPFKADFDSLRDALHDQADHLPADTLWIWDGCEQLDDASLQWQVLADLMQHLPVLPQMLFTSRTPPPNDLSRLQPAGRLETLDWHDLRLSPEESHAIVERITGQVTRQQQEHWHALSKGWAAALVLLAQRGGSPQDAVSVRSTESFDHLAGELLQDVDAQQQQRLMQLAVLPCIPLSLAREILDTREADQALAEMAARWQLMEVSRHREPIYRFHPLLRDYLCRQLERTQSMQAVNALRRRGAAAFEKHGLLEEAADLSCQAEDWPGLLRLVLVMADSLIAAGRYQVLQAWLQRIPAAVADTTPWHSYWLGLCLRFEDREQGWLLLQQAFDRFRDEGQVTGQYAAWLALTEAMLVVFEDLKPLKRMLDEYESLRQRHPRCPDMALRLKSLTLAGSVMSILAPRHPRLARLIRVAEIGVRLVPFRVPRQAAFTYLIMHYANTGQIARMHAMACQLLPRLDEEGLPGPLRLFGHAMIGLHQIIAGEAQPDKVLKAAVRLSQRIGDGMFSTIPRSYLIYYEIISGHLIEAQKRLQELERVTPPENRMYQAAHDFMAGWLAIAEEEPGKGLELCALSKAQCRQLAFDFGRALNTSLRAQTLALQDNLMEARTELDELAQLTEESGSQLLRVMLGLGEAWLACCRGDREDAGEKLAGALAIAERESIMAYPGLLRPVTAELALLASELGIAGGFVQRLVQRWGLAPETLSQLDTAWPWPVRIHTLGRFEVLLGNVRLGSEQASHSRPLELLAALIALGRFQVSKATLCDRLWPDTEADKAHHALDNLIYRLRKLIGSESIRISNGLISLDHSRVWIDCWCLEALADTTASKQLGAAEAADHLLRIYQGQFLAGQEQLWITSARERLRDRYVRLAGRLGEALISEGACENAIELWEHALSHEPLDEGLYLRLMKCLAESGRPADAQRIYLRCRDALQRHLAMAPGEAIQTYARSLGG
ncbi:MAG: BTAD domain-containing putative transcriptional regulator [Candidatus Thiodiazotropha sp.]